MCYSDPQPEILDVEGGSFSVATGRGTWQEPAYCGEGSVAGGAELRYDPYCTPNRQDSCDNTGLVSLHLICFQVSLITALIFSCSFSSVLGDCVAD